MRLLTSRFFFRFELLVWAFGLDFDMTCKLSFLWTRSTGSFGSWSHSWMSVYLKGVPMPKSELLLINYQINSLYLPLRLITYL